MDRGRRRRPVGQSRIGQASCPVRHGRRRVRAIIVFWVVASFAMFIAAASAGKWHAETAKPLPLVVALVLYTLGNLVVIRLMREVGLGAAISPSAVGQLVMVNIIAVAVFRESFGLAQSMGVVLGLEIGRAHV